MLTASQRCATNPPSQSVRLHSLVATLALHLFTVLTSLYIALQCMMLRYLIRCPSTVVHNTHASPAFTVLHTAD